MYLMFYVCDVIGVTMLYVLLHCIVWQMLYVLMEVLYVFEIINVFSSDVIYVSS